MELRKLYKSTAIKHLSSLLIKFTTQLKLKASCCELCLSNKVVHPLICKQCQQDLPLFNYHKLDNDLLLWPATDKLFPKRAFDQLFCLAPYIWPFDQWIKQLKYYNRFEVADLLAYLMCNAWQENEKNTSFGGVLCVPTHIKKWQHRGYNQANLIARAFAQQTNIPYYPNALTRLKNHSSQVGQSGSQRRKSLNNAFALSLHCPMPENLILVDDVITTGSTVNSICRLLKAQGVKNIAVATVALTLPK